MRHFLIGARSLAVSTFLLLAHAGAARAQVGTTGVLVGQVRDSSRAPVPGAILEILGTGIQAVSASDGSYRLANVPAGSRLIVARRLGYRPDTLGIQVAGGATTVGDITLRPAAIQLASVAVTASPRLAETKAGALAVEENAPNIVSALSGDEIRSLPNFNAAEAAGRIPGVSLERDEGEGKFVQVRGTEPRLSNVTIDGVHIPGTEDARIPKLDDVPSDLLAAIEVSKTLTADMDADAIGGSVKLVTKTPEGAPRGYIAGQYGQIALASRNNYQGGLTWGGRFGRDSRLGFLIGGSADRNNRGIDDVEPAWGMYGGLAAPNEWSIRDYRYARERYGVGGGLDYRFDANNQVYLKGLWSLFKNLGTVYLYDIAGDATPANAGSGTIPGASLTRTTETRTPHERLWATTAGGRHAFGAWTLDYAADLAGTSQKSQGYRFSNFDYTGPALNIDYTAPNGATYPQYQFQSAADAQAAADPANYTLSNYTLSDHTTTGHDYGGAANLRYNYTAGGRAGQLQFGARARDEHKDFTSQRLRYADTSSTSAPLTQFAGSFADPGFYSDLSSGYAIGPMADLSSVIAYETAHPSFFNQTRSPASDSLGSFTGSERILAAYVMNTTDLGRLRLNIGMRVEATHATYTGHAFFTPTDTAGNPTGADVLQPVSGARDYTDLFPSVQLRYSVGPQSYLRAAFTRGIARPNYGDLAPNQSGNTCQTCATQPSLSGFSTGNPNLKAQYAWNYDLLFSHYLSSVGVISGGVFYKSLRDVILTRRITYTGPGPFNGYQGDAPDNGGDGWLSGFEAAWTQRLVFLPGWLAGLGFDANFTHTSSQVLVDPGTGRRAQLLRQSPNIANLYVTYDKWPFSARIGWTYNGAMIAGYGDGTPNPSGDTYFYQHGQVDGSFVYNATRAIQIQVQALNINNAVFGFYMGAPGHEFNIQREYYKQTLFVGTKIGF